jgi:hypothetical protein
MSIANALSILLVTVMLALVGMYASSRRRVGMGPEDAEARRRREWIAWEVRGLVVAVAGPCAAGMMTGYVTKDFTLPLLLFVAAGFMAAATIASGGPRVHP